MHSGSAYDSIAEIYDAAIGKGTRQCRIVHRFIRKFGANPVTLLEAGCGTGSNLFYFRKYFDAEGFDSSAKMLEIAGSRPGSPVLYNQRLESFLIGKSYDVIICLYDTINHITSRRGWERFFRRAFMHLNKGGLLIFDFNTLHKLNTLAASPGTLHRFSSGYLSMKVKKLRQNLFNWNLKLLLKQSGGYSELETNIKESSYLLSQIKEMLRSKFTILDVKDESGSAYRSGCGRAYVVCHRK